MTIFGQIVDGAEVETIVENFLKRWLPFYLAEVADQNGLPRDTYMAPRSWTRTPEFTLDESDQLPAILILSAGIDESTIYREGDGSYNASWIIGIAVVVSAKDAESTNTLAKRYGAAIRVLMTQHKSLESDRTDGVTWEDEAYDDLGTDQMRSLASVRLVFTIGMKNIMNDNDGPILPADPPPDPTVPYEDWPVIPDSDHVHINVTNTGSTP